MDRRTFLTTPALAALQAVPVPQVSRERPWGKRAEELQETEGMWCDYAAWIEWVNRRMDDTMPGGCDFMAILDEGDQAGTITGIYLYSLMCGLCDGDELVKARVTT